jgi:hypothetical protein
MSILRAFRVLRVMRLFTVFRELNILLAAFAMALGTVMWVALMAFATNYMFAMLLTEQVKMHDWGEDSADIHLWFGTLGRSMRTLFMVLTLAKWDEIALVMEKHVPSCVVYGGALVYIVTTSFCMVSLITSILSEKLLTAQEEDKVNKQMRMVIEHETFCNELRETLLTLDTDGNGKLSSEEIKNTHIEALQLLLIDMHRIADIQMSEEEFVTFVEDVTAMIGFVRPETGELEVDIDDLVDALRSVKGPAQAEKLWELSMHVHKIGSQMEATQRELAATNKKLDLLCNHLLGPGLSSG